MNINRYMFYKNLFKDYLIMYLNNNIYRAYFIDKVVLKYIDNLNEVNILFVDNEDNVEVKKQEKNKYYEYYIKAMIIDSVEKRLNVYKKS